uniref:Glycosyltransferase family 92 protein n=1 Tax=Ascaris lumbricoides TaxID=6252 RepID=A0A0M3IXH8_ASCLU
LVLRAPHRSVTSRSLLLSHPAPPYPFPSSFLRYGSSIYCSLLGAFFRTSWHDNLFNRKFCRCNYGGRFANAVLPKEEIEEVLHRKSSIFIGYSSEPYVRKRIRLIDSRVDSSRPRPHRLAICVSPIMQLAAWVLLPRFFEASDATGSYVSFVKMWILHGATKFYPIVQSMTPEFDAMLRIYESDPTIDIERIPWGMLPTRGSYVSFVKMWILHGATKFYTMVQSMTSEFDAMLRIYENDPTIDIERIPWGMLPTDEDVASENNPNNQIPGADVEKQIIL